MTPRAFAGSSHRAYDEFHRAMLALAGLPLLERIEAANQLPPRMLAGHPLLLVFAPSCGKFLKSVGRSEATRDAMKCLVALRRWELAGKGLSPDLDLEEVARAAGMAEVPRDPFRRDGGPLRLVVRQGEPIVYSIGLDGQDHGGSIDSNLGDKPLGDYLYRLNPSDSGR